jgi:hypothetical protein
MVAMDPGAQAAQTVETRDVRELELEQAGENGDLIVDQVQCKPMAQEAVTQQEQDQLDRERAGKITETYLKLPLEKQKLVMAAYQGDKKALGQLSDADRTFLQELKEFEETSATGAVTASVLVEDYKGTLKEESLSSAVAQEFSSLSLEEQQHVIAAYQKNENALNGLDPQAREAAQEFADRLSELEGMSNKVGDTAVQNLIDDTVRGSLSDFRRDLSAQDRALFDRELRGMGMDPENLGSLSGEQAREALRMGLSSSFTETGPSVIPLTREMIVDGPDLDGELRRIYLKNFGAEKDGKSPYGTIMFLCGELQKGIEGNQTAIQNFISASEGRIPADTLAQMKVQLLNVEVLQASYISVDGEAPPPVAMYGAAETYRSISQLAEPIMDEAWAEMESIAAEFKGDFPMGADKAALQEFALSHRPGTMSLRVSERGAHDYCMNYDFTEERALQLVDEFVAARGVLRGLSNGLVDLATEQVEFYGQIFEGRSDRQAIESYAGLAEALHDPNHIAGANQAAMAYSSNPDVRTQLEGIFVSRSTSPEYRERARRLLQDGHPRTRSLRDHRLDPRAEIDLAANFSKLVLEASGHTLGMVAQSTHSTQARRDAALRGLLIK